MYSKSYELKNTLKVLILYKLFKYYFPYEKQTYCRFLNFYYSNSTITINGLLYVHNIKDTNKRSETAYISKNRSLYNVVFTVLNYHSSSDQVHPRNNLFKVVIITDLGQRQNQHKMLKIQQIIPKLHRCLLYVVFHYLEPKNAGLVDIKRDLH